MDPAEPRIPSAAAVPGAPPPHAVDKGVKNIGIVSLILSILMILWSLFQTGSSLMMIFFTQHHAKMFAPPSGSSVDPESAKIAAKMQGHMVNVSLINTGRYLLILTATGVLLYIAARLLRGDPKALPGARAWTLWAFGVVAISALIQLGVLLPMQLGLQKDLWGPAHGSGATTDFMSFWGMISVVVGTVLLSVWPVALRIWAGRADERIKMADIEAEFPSVDLR